MTVTAKQVQDLRKMSGAGMMDCKAALAENNADIDLAFQWLRKKELLKLKKNLLETQMKVLYLLCPMRLEL